MERPRRLARLAAAAGALLLVGTASACSSGPLAPGPAVTVNGVEITRAQVADEVAATNRFYADAAEAGLEGTDYGALADAMDGAGADTVDRGAVTTALLTLVQDELVRQELADADALPGQAELDAQREQLTQQVGADTLKELDDAFIDRFIESQALATALQQLRADTANDGAEAPDPAAVEAQRDERFAQLAEEQPYCFLVIRSDTEAAADAALARIEAGEAFGTVADEVSTLKDQYPGGYVGCGDATQLSNALSVDVSTAAVGDRFGPLETQGASGTAAWDLVEIASITGPTREVAQAQLEQEIPSTVAPVDPASVDLQVEVGELLADADIWVDPRYGTWNPTTQILEEPVGATTTTLPVAVSTPDATTAGS